MRAPRSYVVATTTTANQTTLTSALKSRTLSPQVSLYDKRPPRGNKRDSGAASTPRPMTAVAIFLYSSPPASLSHPRSTPDICRYRQA